MKDGIHRDGEIPPISKVVAVGGARNASSIISEKPGGSAKPVSGIAAGSEVTTAHNGPGHVDKVLHALHGSNSEEAGGADFSDGGGSPNAWS